MAAVDMPQPQRRRSGRHPNARTPRICVEVWPRLKAASWGWPGREPPFAAGSLLRAAAVKWSSSLLRHDQQSRHWRTAILPRAGGLDEYGGKPGFDQPLPQPALRMRKPPVIPHDDAFAVMALHGEGQEPVRFQHARALGEAGGELAEIDEDIRRDDEIGGLIHSYNLMVSRLSDMIERVYDTELSSQKTKLQLKEIELERHKAEFQALQLQINPHFLYNTLETINCYAIVQDSDEISEMVEAMAFMLRYSIQTNLEEVTLANELNHVRNYMIIQKHRIGRDFEIEVATPPALLLSRMVRLTLQPIVENIFQHAFPDGIELEHSIRIDTYEDGEELLVVVEDNGVGMTEARRDELIRRLGKNRLAEEQAANRPGRRGGIGLVNVHRRIQMVYGDEYGLRVDSTPGQGTRIELRMPKEERARQKPQSETA